MSPTTMATNPQYLSKGVNYLREIARIVGDLSGLRSLVLELIQNAEDAPARTLTLDVTDDSLVVYNDGEFSSCGELNRDPDDCPKSVDGGRRCDFHSFRELSSGDKRLSDQTIGAFGIGFTAVYQITDRPELISNGEHWILDETKVQERRLEVCPGCGTCSDNPKGTTFRLPWARDARSRFREKTGLQPCSVSPDTALEELSGSVPTALIFLRHIETVDLLRNGDRKHRFSRSQVGDDVTVTANGEATAYRLARGTLSPQPELENALERRDSGIAVAVSPQLDRGLLYAFLPTEDSTEIPLHIHADFIPRSDRRHIAWDGPKGEWNRRCIERCAELLGESLERFRTTLGAPRLWALIRRSHELASSSADGPDTWRDAFWGALKGQLATSEIGYSSTEEWRAPPGLHLLPDRALSQHAGTLAELGVETFHPDVSAVYSIPRERIGSRTFTSKLLAEALETLESPTLPNAARYWEVIDALIAVESSPSTSRLAALPLAPALDGSLIPFREALIAHPETVDVFAPALGRTRFLDEDRWDTSWTSLRSLCVMFSAGVAIQLLQATDLKGLDQEPAARIVSWFRSHESDLHGLEAAVAELSIFPTPAGLMPLTSVALPGGFEDVLGLGHVLSLELLGESAAFLGRIGAKPMTLENYLSSHVPAARARIEEEPELGDDLVDLLASRLHQIEDSEVARDALIDLPIVRTEHGYARPRDSYLPTDHVRRTLGDSVPIASSSNRALEWLGVGAEPRPGDLLARIAEISSDEASPSAKATMQAIVAYLGEWFDRTRVADEHLSASLGPFEQLRDAAWLPARLDTTRWFPPGDLDMSFQEHLFSSQGRFIDLPLPQQRALVDFLGTLGVRRSPRTRAIVDHLLHCADTGVPVHTGVYTTLNERANDYEIDDLLDRKCLALTPTDEGATGAPEDSVVYVAPYQAFWNDHPFGRFAHRLDQRMSSHARLLERLEIRGTPAAEDACRVLLDIGRTFGPPHNTPLDVEAARVVETCWTMIGQEDDDLQNDLTSHLGEVATILDGRQVLNPPPRMYVDDLPGLAEQIPQLTNNLAKRLEHAWRAMVRAGARLLSDETTVHILEAVAPVPDVQLRQLLVERQNALLRVIDHTATDQELEPRQIRPTDIEPVAVGDLRIQYSVEGFTTAQRFDSRPLASSAHFDIDTQQLLVLDGTRDWTAISKEVVRACLSGRAASRAGPAVRAVLTADSRSEAEHMLDGFEIPRLESADPISKARSASSVFSQTSDDNLALDDVTDVDPVDMETANNGTGSTSTTGRASTGADRDAGDRSPASAVDLRSGSLAEPGATTSPDPVTAGPPATRDQQKGPGSPLSHSRPKRYRLRSYVVPANIENTPSQEADNIRIGDAGVDHVMAFEVAQGRAPERMPHNNEGFDILSLERDGTKRYIEVKAVEGPWALGQASLTPAQHRFALEKRERCWLYVVELAVTDTPQVWLIQDPVARVSEYLFDDGWRAVAELGDPGGPANLDFLDADDVTPYDGCLPFFDLDADQPGVISEGQRWVACTHPPPSEGMYVCMADALAPDLAGQLVVIQPRLDGSASGRLVLCEVASETGGRQRGIRVCWLEGERIGLVRSDDAEAWHDLSEVTVLGHVIGSVEPNAVTAGPITSQG